MGQITLTEMVTKAFAICVLTIVGITALSIALTVVDAIMQPVHVYLKKVVTHYLDERWRERRNG